MKTDSRKIVAAGAAVAVVCLVGGALVGLWGAVKFPSFDLFGQREESSDSQVINAVDRVEQVALVSLGIQGITESRSNSEVLGIKVPGSDRVTFIQYSFNGKLGIDGAGVTVTPTGEHMYRVTIPKFIFIGYDNLDFKVAAENNGVLSWVTEDIDTLDIVNDVLDENAQQQYLRANTDVLKDQSETFYRSIITSVDPDAVVEFTFSNSGN